MSTPPDVPNVARFPAEVYLRRCVEVALPASCVTLTKYPPSGASVRPDGYAEPRLSTLQPVPLSVVSGAPLGWKRARPSVLRPPAEPPDAMVPAVTIAPSAS